MEEAVKKHMTEKPVVGLVGKYIGFVRKIIINVIQLHATVATVET